MTIQHHKIAIFRYGNDSRRIIQWLVPVSHPNDSRIGVPPNSHKTIGRILRGEEPQGEVATSGGYSFIVLDELRWIDSVCGSANIQSITTQYEQNKEHACVRLLKLFTMNQMGTVRFDSALLKSTICPMQMLPFKTDISSWLIQFS